MVTCSLCDSKIDIEEEELDEGDLVTCEECGAEFRVIGVNPLELEALEEEDDEEDPDFEEEDEEDESWR